MSSGPAQTQLANPTFFQQMDPSLSRPVYRDRGGRVAGGPVWSVGPIVQDLTASAIVNAGATTLTAAQVLGGHISASSSGNVALTMPASTDLLQGLSAVIGSLTDLPRSDVNSNGPIRRFYFTVHNTGANTWTMTAGSGTPAQTVVGTATIAAGAFATFAVQAQVSSAGTPSIAIVRIQ